MSLKDLLLVVGIMTFVLVAFALQESQLKQMQLSAKSMKQTTTGPVKADESIANRESPLWSEGDYGPIY